MTMRKSMATIALAAGLALGGGAVLAHGAGDARTGQDTIGQKTMGQGMMGPGMMGKGMMGQGMMGKGMMGKGMMGQGMMNPGMMNPGMMNPGMMNPCMIGYGMHGPVMMGPAMMGLGMHGPAMMGHGAGQDLSADDVRKMLERHLVWLGNERLKLGEVKQKDDDTIVADIVTLDDSLVRRLEFNRHGGFGFMHGMH